MPRRLVPPSLVGSRRRKKKREEAGAQLPPRQGSTAGTVINMYVAVASRRTTFIGRCVKRRRPQRNEHIRARRSAGPGGAAAAVPPLPSEASQGERPPARGARRTCQSARPTQQRKRTTAPTGGARRHKVACSLRSSLRSNMGSAGADLLPKNAGAFHPRASQIPHIVPAERRAHNIRKPLSQMNFARKITGTSSSARCVVTTKRSSHFPEPSPTAEPLTRNLAAFRAARGQTIRVVWGLGADWPSRAHNRHRRQGCTVRPHGWLRQL